MDDEKKISFEKIKCTLIPMITNMVFGITNRILQIIDYCLNYYEKKNYKFHSEEVQFAALIFCFLPTVVCAFMMLLYSLLHYEKILTFKVKIKNFFLFILSTECLYPIGVHLSLKTKYSDYSDNPLITMRFVNAVHFMLVALPQLLIVPINCSAKEEFNPVDIASLIFSSIFMLWSVGYYFICITYNNENDDFITDCVFKEKNE